MHKNNKFIINGVADTIFIMCIFFLIIYFIVLLEMQANHRLNDDSIFVRYNNTDVKYTTVCISDYLNYKIESKYDNNDNFSVTYKPVMDSNYTPIKCNQ